MAYVENNIKADIDVSKKYYCWLFYNVFLLDSLYLFLLGYERRKYKIKKYVGKLFQPIYSESYPSSANLLKICSTVACLIE